MWIRWHFDTNYLKEFGLASTWWLWWAPSARGGLREEKVQEHLRRREGGAVAPRRSARIRPALRGREVREERRRQDPFQD